MKKELIVGVFFVAIALFVGVSYATTGKLATNPANWFRPKYQLSFDVKYGAKQVITGIDIKNIQVRKSRTLGKFGLLHWVACKVSKFKGTVVAKVQKPDGTRETVVDKSFQICVGNTKSFKGIFTSGGAGNYKVSITVYKDARIVDQVTRTFRLGG